MQRSNIQSDAAPKALELLHIRSAPGYDDHYVFGPKFELLKTHAAAWIEGEYATLDFTEWVDEQARAGWVRENYADSETSSVSSFSEPEFSGIVEHTPGAHRIIGFAEWAFGPRGLPSLRILAVGDFSYPLATSTATTTFPFTESVRSSLEYNAIRSDSSSGSR